MKTTAVIALLLITLPTWAGTFRDNFEDGDLDGWEISLKGGKVESREGELVISDVGRTWATTAFVRDGQELSDFSISVDWNMVAVNPGERAPYIWVAFRFVEDVAVAYYVHELGNDPYLAIWTLPVVWNNGLTKVPIGPVQIDTWYHVRIEMRGSRVKLWINDEFVQEVDWENQAGLPEKGKLGVGTGGSTGYFDNVLVTSDEIPDSNKSVSHRGKLTVCWADLKHP
jgi:hypothetical protein